MTVTRERLKELFEYSPESGNFTRLMSSSPNAQKGAIAGTLDHGYIRIRIDGTTYYAHRLVWLYLYGVFPTNEVDHINGNRSDNRLENLRIATSQDNKRNRGKDDRSTSGRVGVSFNKHHGRWEAYITVCYRRMFLGLFDDFMSAVLARAQAEKEHFGRFARAI